MPGKSETLHFESSGRDFAASLMPNAEPQNLERDKAVLSIVHHCGDHPLIRQAIERFRRSDIEVFGDRVPRNLEGTVLEAMKLYRVTTPSEKRNLFIDLDRGVECHDSLDGQLHRAGQKDKQTLLAAATAYQVLMNTEQALVLEFAEQYSRKVPLPMWELAQEAMGGLSVAIRRFRINDGNAFSSFAVPWIRHEMSRYFETKGRMMPIPETFERPYRDILKIQQERQALAQPELSYEELADLLNSTYPHKTFTASKVAHIMEVSSVDVLSLNVRVAPNDVESPELIEEVSAGNTTWDVIEATARQAQNQPPTQLAKNLAELVLRRAGLPGGQKVTLGLLYGLAAPEGEEVDFGRRMPVDSDGYSQLLESGNTIGNPDEIAALSGATTRSLENNALKAVNALARFLDARGIKHEDLTEPDFLDKLDQAEAA